MQETKYTINDLRRHLFETIAELRADKIEVPKAEAIKNLCQTIVDSGRLECRYIEVAGGEGSGFMPDSSDAKGARERLRLSTWPRQT